MTAHTDLAALAQALRERIAADNELLGQVLDMWARSGSDDKSTDSMDSLIAMKDIDMATHGKVTKSRAQWLARNRDSNGLSDCFVKIGRELHVDLPKLRARLAGGVDHAT